MSTESIGNLDFVVAYRQFLIVIGWLEAGGETHEKIYLRCTDEIHLMPDKGVWYFREDVNKSLKKEDNVKRGFVLAFADHALVNKDIMLVVGEMQSPLFSRRIYPDQIKEIDSLPKAASEFIQNIIKDPSAKGHTFSDRIKLTARQFFWCSRSFFVVSGTVDAEGYAQQHNQFSIIAGSLRLSPSNVIYTQKKRVGKNDENTQTRNGFLLVFELTSDDSFEGFTTCQLQLANKEAFGYASLETSVDVTTREKSEILLSHLEIEPGNLFSVFESGIGLALNRLWEKIYATDGIEIDLLSYGDLPTSPKVSIVVPLYGRIDFVMYQMAIVANDADFLRNAELIYVLDDPRQYKTMREYMDSHYPVYRVPFKLIRYDKNLGYAKANNIGARHATAKLLILMNSDVMPIHHRWVSRCVELFDSLDNAGVAGIKLLFEDGTLQHQGMWFERMPELDNAWVNVHPGKNTIPAGEIRQAVRVPAVTGAFLITLKSLYDDVGGLDETYVLGDFEDSDFCLKCHEKGFFAYYLPQIQMYHLERQSHAMVDNLQSKDKVTLYNCWKHSSRWNDTIERVMKGYDNGR